MLCQDHMELYPDQLKSSMGVFTLYCVNTILNFLLISEKACTKNEADRICFALTL